jgi:6-pyruvoyltetrahydropterin/6-carboxytetrahydropterin synthase
MYRISKSFEFSASHVLDGLPEGHQCGRLHGHNYGVEVELEGAELDPTGFVLDYGELKPVKAWIDSTLDHRHLNDVVDFQPSAERLAEWMHARVVETLDSVPGSWTVAAIRLHETPKTCAEYRPAR